MKIINPSNAINAKILSKYGKRLKEKDYLAMIKFKRISEIVTYLKNSDTQYQKFLSSIDERTIKRGELEQIIRKNIFLGLFSLCRYENSGDGYFKEFFVMYLETKEISTFLSLLSIGQQKEYRYLYPNYLEEFTHLDFKRIILSNTYEELLEALKSSPYYPILNSFKTSDNETLDISRILDSLDRFIQDTLYKNIYKRKYDIKDIKKLFNLLNDFENATRIYRLKKFYNMPDDLIFSHLRHHGDISDNKAKLMIENTSYEDFIDLITKQFKISYNKSDVYDNFEQYLNIKKYEYTNRTIHFTQSTDTVIMCYIILSENELYNIINIIEGVRYGLTPEEIDSLLIY